MPVDNVQVQVQQAAARGGLIAAFGQIEFMTDGIASVADLSDGEDIRIAFGNVDGPLGTIHLEAYDSGNPEDAGLTLGLRGWELDDSVAAL